MLLRQIGCRLLFSIAKVGIFFEKNKSCSFALEQPKVRKVLILGTLKKNEQFFSQTPLAYFHPSDIQLLRKTKHTAYTVCSISFSISKNVLISVSYSH